MRLFLVQHGTAVSKDVDPDRPLSAEGAREVGEMVAFLARRRLSVDEVWHSGKTRARQTAMSLAGALRGAAVREREGLGPKDDVAPLVEVLRRRDANLMIVGHLPFLSRLASGLLTGDAEREIIAFHNAGVVCLERNEEDLRWRIEWLAAPELLEREPRRLD